MSIALSASEITLPAVNKGWVSVFDFLCDHFEFISADIWKERIQAGKVHWYQGEAITEQTPFMPSKRLCYYREVAKEPVIPFLHHIVFQNEHILVAEKPHFLPVTPGGEYVNECLLARVKKETGLADIVPVHRLDKDTAGLVLFSLNPNSRALYYQLFSEGNIEKHYQAIAKLTDEVKSEVLPKTWQIQNRIEKSQPKFLNKIVEGEANALSSITLVSKKADLGLFELTPITGKTHQLRIHMLSLGMPILHDNYYPELLPKKASDFSKPLQLLAKTLRFMDPVSNTLLHFSAKQCLSLNDI